MKFYIGETSEIMEMLSKMLIPSPVPQKSKKSDVVNFEELAILFFFFMVALHSHQWASCLLKALIQNILELFF